MKTKQTAGKTRLFQIIGVMAACTLLLGGCSSQMKGNSSAASGDSVKDMATCTDLSTGLMWQTKTSKTLNSLEDAQQYAQNLKAGGYDDWRLPTVAELYNLYMTFDLHQNGDCQMKLEGIYWSAEEDMQGRVGTWELDDNCDPEREYIPKKKGTVRAVRL